MVSTIAAITLSFLRVTLVMNRLELIANATYVEIEIKAPINAPLISMKVNAAKTVAFSTDSKLTIVMYHIFGLFHQVLWLHHLPFRILL